MATQKIDVLALGRGDLSNNANAAIVFSANNIVALYSAGTTYSQYNVVEYSGNVYRSKINSNTGNTPSSSPSSWETMYIGVKDGDVAYVFSGANSTTLQRINSLWQDLAGQPATVALVDGQVSPADAFVFLANGKSYAQVNYTIRRGSDQSRKRFGTYNVSNDNFSTVQYDHGYNQIGADVEVTVSWALTGGNVRMQYTSVSEGLPIELRYTIKGWN
jgi:hypothetical protein